MKGKLIFKKGERARLVFRRDDDEIDATDAALALAREEVGVGAEALLSGIDGTGKDGRVTLKDVRAVIGGGE